MTTNQSERLPQIIEQLGDENPDVRGWALSYAAGFGAEGKPAVPIASVPSVQRRLEIVRPSQVLVLHTNLRTLQHQEVTRE